MRLPIALGFHWQEWFEVHSPFVRVDTSLLSRLTITAFLVWTLFMLALVVWISWEVDDQAIRMAYKEAVANFNKDQAFRIWATGHGGVYVPVTEDTQPSPYLAHIPERDITTPSGRALTLMNPAYMLRQMMDQYSDLYGVKGRITSLTPLNPGNAPDPWERAALQAFEDGRTQEVFEVTEIDGEPYLRLIRPMTVGKGCLFCHGHQGYNVGDVRGGVGVYVPLAEYYSAAESSKATMRFSFGGIWLLGMAGIGWIGRHGRLRLEERKTFEQQIWHQANFDPLTRLANRNLFQDRLQLAIAQAAREGSQLALMFIDLDRFKDVNDTQGHHIGDELLIHAADRLRACVRASDTVARMGGDEFVVVIEGVERVEDVAAVGRKILKELSIPFQLGRNVIHLSASIGITIYPEDGNSSLTLLKNADTAMYQAKEDGRNTYRFFNWDMTRRARERVALENDLRVAMVEGQLSLNFQPIVEVANGRCVGAEALLRWQHPQRGWIPPEQFIPLAEDSGLIVPIGNWVLENAVEHWERWRAAGGRYLHLNLNVSTLQCRSKEFPAKIDQLLADHPELMGWLTLEITESLFIGAGDEVVDLLAGLRARGLYLSVDDFGTGYSSLSYLKRFPLDELKIDRSFVSDLPHNEDDAAVCEAIIDMSHRLGLSVVAEGVEKASQLDFLRGRGCELAQGFYIGRPMAAEEFLQYLGGCGT